MDKEPEQNTKLAEAIRSHDGITLLRALNDYVENCSCVFTISDGQPKNITRERLSYDTAELELKELGL